MATHKVTAPPERAGWTKVAGVAFTAGQAVVDDATDVGKRALAYFRRHGYQVELAKKPAAAKRTPATETAVEQ